jgi:hypothetical protein
VAAAAGNDFTSTTCASVTSGPTGVASCTPAAAASGNDYTATTCTTATTGPTGVESCTPVTAAADNRHTTTTCTTASTGPAGVESCTPVTAAAGNAYTATTCDTLVSGPDEVASCTPVTATAPGWQSTSCDFLPGHKLQTRIQTAMTTILRSGGFETSQSTTTDDLPFAMSTASVTPMPRHWRPRSVPCRTRRTFEHQRSPTAESAAANGPVPSIRAITGGSSNSLADVAQYYYVTDLRPD